LWLGLRYFYHVTTLPIYWNQIDPEPPEHLTNSNGLDTVCSTHNTVTPPHSIPVNYIEILLYSVVDIAIEFTPIQCLEWAKNKITQITI